VKYDFDISIDDSNSSHTLIVGFVGSEKDVLDLGSATGALGAALKRNGCRVTGVEVDAEAAKVAAAVLDRVVANDLNDPATLTQFPKASFDFVICGDVLEHLADPERVLTDVRPLLRLGGAVVLSIPNVAHADVRLSLLAGRFDYQPLGLLDDTHIRFFTRTSLQALLARAGFSPVAVQRTTSPAFGTEIRIQPAEFPPEVISAVQASGEATTYQFVIKAVPSDQLAGALPEIDVWGEPGPTLLDHEEWNSRFGLERALVGSVARMATMLPPPVSRSPRALSHTPYEYGLDAAQDREGYRLRLEAVGERDAARRRRHLEQLAADSPPQISVLVPVYRPDIDLLDRCVESVRRQTYQNWQLCLCDDGSGDPEVQAALARIEVSDPRITVARRERNGGISAATNSAAEAATGEFLALLDQDDEYEPGALAAAAVALCEDGEIDLLYTDEDKIDPDGGRSEPFFKPNWSPDQLTSHMYLGHLLVFRRSLFDAVGGFRSEYDGSQDYDLVLRLSEKARKVAHVPIVCYHWRKIEGSTAQDYRAKPGADLAARAALADAARRRGWDATVEPGLHEGTFRVRHAVSGSPLVSVIVPFHDGAEYLRRCVTALRERAGYEHFEVILVDNNSWEPETRAVLDRLTEDSRCRIVPYPQPFNWAAINNHTAQFARGDHLLFLNVDVEGGSDGWLAALVEQSQRPEVGAVGGRLLYPNGMVQHAGVVMGLGGGVAWHAFCFLPGDQPGYFGQAKVIRNYCAVTGACMMVRRDVFDSLGGFDRALPVAYNDIDFCLRLREAGYRVVFTPFSELVHEESAVRGHASREPVETAIMWERWAPVIRNDPYFNPNLDPRRSECALDAGLEEDPWQTLVSTVEKWLTRSGATWPQNKSSSSHQGLAQLRSSTSSFWMKSGATSTPTSS
jgi:GT2 family glycosyltransferase/SAM-dependent methyltransferase